MHWASRNDASRIYRSRSDSTINSHVHEQSCAHASRRADDNVIRLLDIHRWMLDEVDTSNHTSQAKRWIEDFRNDDFKDLVAE